MRAGLVRGAPSLVGDVAVADGESLDEEDVGENQPRRIVGVTLASARYLCPTLHSSIIMMAECWTGSGLVQGMTNVPFMP
ncbi:hypothetical protein [Flindersiella endophytica]